MPFGIQPWHLIVVLIVALVIFGPSRLPKLGRSIGSFFRDLRTGAREMGNGLKEGIQESDVPKDGAAESTQGTKTPPAPDGAATERGNYCTHCGAANPLHARFCNTCGKSISA